VSLDHGTPTVAVKIQGAERILIVDSGSSCSLLQPGVAEVPLESTTLEPFGLTGDSLDIVVEQQVSFQIGRITFSHSFLVCILPTSADGIIGLTFLTPRQTTLDLGSLSLKVCLHSNLDLVASSQHEALLEESKRRERRDLITHVSIPQNPSRDGSVEPGCIKSTRNKNLRNFGEKPPKTKEINPQPHEVALNDSEACTVISKETVVLQPRAKHTVLGKVQGGNSRNPSCLLCVEPAHVPTEGICVARVLTRPSVTIYRSQPVGKSALSTSCAQLNMHAPDVPHDLKVSKQLDSTPEIRYAPDSITLMITNFSDEELTLHKGTILGVAQEVSENLVVSIIYEDDTNRGTEQNFFWKQ